MKKFVYSISVLCAVLTIVAIFIQSWFLFAAVGILLAIVALICGFEITENLKEINTRISKNKEYHLEIDTAREKIAYKELSQRKASIPPLSKRNVDYSNAKCANCDNNIDRTHCHIYDIKPFANESGYCDSYNPIS